MNNDDNQNVWNIYVKPTYRKSKQNIFQIIDYKSIKKLKIKLDKLTILVGENASGKSNILTFFKKYSAQFFDLDKWIKDISKAFYPHASGSIQKYRSSSDLIKIQTVGTNEYTLSISLMEDSASFKVSSISFNTKELPLESTLQIGSHLLPGVTGQESTQKYLNRTFKKGFKSEEAGNKKLFEDYIPFFATYIDVSNFTRELVEEQISLQLMNFIDIGFDIKINQNDVYEILSFLPNITNEINHILYNDIELKKVDSANQQDKEISIYLSLDTENTKRGFTKINGFKILVRDEAENKIFPPHMKSSGINNIISIVITLEFLRYLIKKFPNKNYSNLNFLFIIDEPELYLHPKIQKNLMKYIYNISVSNENIFFLLATHSPYIINPHVFESTYIVEYEYNKGTIVNNLIDMIENNKEKYNVLSPIEDALGIAFNEFLHPIIFVEGEEEFYLFRNISNIYNYTNSLHCLSGKNKFAPIAILLNKFKDKNKNFKIFLDADFSFKDDFKSVENGSILLDSLSRNIFFIGKNIYDFNSYKKLQKKEECLEDLIIFNIFEDTEYEYLFTITKEIFEKYFNIEFQLKKESITNFLSVSKYVRGVIMSNKESGTSKMKQEFLVDETFYEKKPNEISYFIETSLKNLIKEKLFNNNEKFKKFENLIKPIIQK